MRERLWRRLARIFKGLAEVMEAWGDEREKARHFPRGTVVRIVSANGCSCATKIEGREFVVAYWNAGSAGRDYSLRVIGPDGVGSAAHGMEYACERVWLEDTGRRAKVGL